MGGVDVVVGNQTTREGQCSSNFHLQLGPLIQLRKSKKGAIKHPGIKVVYKVSKVIWINGVPVRKGRGGKGLS